MKCKSGKTKNNTATPTKRVIRSITGRRRSATVDSAVLAEKYCEWVGGGTGQTRAQVSTGFRPRVPHCRVTGAND